MDGEHNTLAHYQRDFCLHHCPLLLEYRYRLIRANCPFAYVYQYLLLWLSDGFELYLV
jgi:hypothetical protein